LERITRLQTPVEKKFIEEKFLSLNL